jgi:hypothetical protein
MDVMIAILAIASATTVLPPTNVTDAKASVKAHEVSISGDRANAVIYFDAPVHSVPTYLR